jgi:hypothetical protein
MKHLAQFFGGVKLLNDLVAKRGKLCRCGSFDTVGCKYTDHDVLPFFQVIFINNYNLRADFRS